MLVHVLEIEFPVLFDAAETFGRPVTGVAVHAIFWVARRRARGGRESFVEDLKVSKAKMKYASIDSWPFEKRLPTLSDLPEKKLPNPEIVNGLP